MGFCHWLQYEKICFWCWTLKSDLHINIAGRQTRQLLLEQTLVILLLYSIFVCRKQRSEWTHQWSVTLSYWHSLLSILLLIKWFPSFFTSLCFDYTCLCSWWSLQSLNTKWVWWWIVFMIFAFHLSSVLCGAKVKKFSGVLWTVLTETTSDWSTPYIYIVQGYNKH